MKKQAGLDGCKGGWILCEIDGSKTSFSYLKNLVDLNTAEFETILIDIPLYLAENGHRPSEIQAKKLLKKRSASIFFTPTKEAINEKDYNEGLRINRLLIGKGFSKQAYNLFPKILEAARFKENNPELIFESHPELCFLGWNGGALKHSKKTREGKNERLDLIKRIYKPGLSALNNLPFKGFEEDAIDAMILAITARERHRFTFLGEKEKEAIVYFSQDA